MHNYHDICSITYTYTQKYYNYDITILNFKTISDRNIMTMTNIIILCSLTNNSYKCEHKMCSYFTANMYQGDCIYMYTYYMFFKQTESFLKSMSIHYNSMYVFFVGYSSLKMKLEKQMKYTQKRLEKGW